MSERKPRLLDLFCGAGGAAMGYHRAGFEVVGVDLEPQPDYPFAFNQGDAIDVLTSLASGGYMGARAPTALPGDEDLYRLTDFDAIHASPPCHDHSTISGEDDGTGHLLPDTIAVCKASGLPWVVENVVGRSVVMDGWYFTLCGSMFGMQVRRHRRFGASFAVLSPGCNHTGPRPWTITGHGGGHESRHSKKPSPRDFWRYMDMPWMEGRPAYGVAQAIPPAYTEHIGAYLMLEIQARSVTDSHTRPTQNR